MKKCIKIMTSLTAIAVMILFGLTIYLDIALPNKFYVVEGEKVVLHSKLALSMENDEPLKTEPTEEPDENEEEQKPDKQRKTPDSMIYSPSKTTASLMQKISASAPKGVPINQLDKRLALLK